MNRALSRFTQRVFTSSKKVPVRCAGSYIGHIDGNPDALARGPPTDDVNDRGKHDPAARKTYSYMMLGGAGVAYATMVKSGVTDLLSTMSPAADVLAMASVEVDLSTIPEGTTVTVKWRGKPLFIKHRTAQDIEIANSVDVSTLRDPQHDSERVQNPKYLILLGVCTHLGCVPVSDAGDYHGWFCPCHGSHYDISGRIRRGPAPLNLEIPPYKFTDDSTVVVG